MAAQRRSTTVGVVALALATLAPSASAGERGIVLESLGVRLDAPLGASCVRVPDAGDGPLACDRACYAGHPTPTRLPVDPGGVIRIRTGSPAGAVTVRPLGGVGECSAHTGPIGPDLAAQQADCPTSWRLRLPDPLEPAGAVQVIVGTRSYYARISTRYGRLWIRERAADSARVLRLTNRAGTVLIRRAAPRQPLRLATRLAAGRYRVSVSESGARRCSASLRLRAGQRVRVQLGSPNLC